MDIHYKTTISILGHLRLNSLTFIRSIPKSLFSTCTDGKPLVGGPGYYILHDVAQENNDELLDGSPHTFLLAIPNRDGIIRESSDLNIMFSNATTSGQPAVWRIEDANGYQVVTSHGTVGSPGAETVNSWFKIVKYDNDYKIVFCPTVCNTCRPTSGEVGYAIAKSGRRSLLLSTNPLKVKFKKA